MPDIEYIRRKTIKGIDKGIIYPKTVVEAVEGLEEYITKPYSSLRRLGSYLYEVTFTNIPDFTSINTPIVSGCTSFVREGCLYRNLDWNYDECNEFLVICNGFKGMAMIPSITDDNMDDDLIGQLPYYLNDGVNDYGIMVSSHVLYNDFNFTSSGSTFITKLPYLILSTLKSIEDIDLIEPYLNDLKINQTLIDSEYLMQFLVTDGTVTYIITPSNSGYTIINISTNPKLTNFKWVNRTTVNRIDNDIQLRPTGIERWNLVESSNIEDLKFTECYKSSDRLSEFIGLRSTTKYSTDEELVELYDIASTLYQDRTRDGSLWQTVHSIVYDNNGIKHLWVQENWNVDYISQSGDSVEQIQADWNETSVYSKAYIKNKPSLAEVAVSGDYNDLNNKPTIPSIEGLATVQQLNQGLETKQNTINDLTTIRTNAQAGKNASDTIAGYGDIVTHNTSEFATSSQGTKADTALQPSALDDYRTSSAQDAIDEAIQGDIVVIENKIPSQATSSNQLADKDFVNSSINSITAFYITKDAQGSQFATKAQLDSTTTFYSGGEVRVPTRNDYCIVLADETKTDPVTGENPTTRYIYQNGWEFQYIVNKTTLTSAQLAAINSGITSGKVTQYDGYSTSKQDTISDLATIRSGATLGATAYQKPSTGIPASDLANGVIPDISVKENTSNKVASFQNIPDNTHYPTEKLVYDSLAQKLSNYDFIFLQLADNTTSFSFPANQQCHRKVRIAASATLNFAVENKACNYVRVYNSGSSEITLAIGTVTHNSTAVAAKVGPAEIKCGVGKYVEISVIYDGSDATFTASDNLQILS